MVAGGAGGGRASAAAGCRAAQSPEAGARSGPQPRSLRPSPPPRRAGGRTKWPLRCGLVLGPQLGVLGMTPGASRPLPPRPGSVRFLGGIGRGRLAVPERAENGFPHVAEEAPGVLERCREQGAGRRLPKRGARMGCGARSCGPPRALGGSREETLRDSYVGEGRATVSGVLLQDPES